MWDTPPMKDLTKTNINLPLKNVSQGWKKAKHTEHSGKKLKKIKTDKSATKLLEQDLSAYIHPENFKPVQFKLKPKN